MFSYASSSSLLDIVHLNCSVTKKMTYQESHINYMHTEMFYLTEISTLMTQFLMPQCHPFSFFLSICTINVLGESVLFGKSSFVGREVSLVVKECLPEDAGAYTCVAENTAGKTSSSAAVCVRGKYV